MSVRRLVATAGSVCVGVLAALLAWNALMPGVTQASESDYFFDVRFLEGKTDSDGDFAIEHGVFANPTGPEPFIAGMMVAAQNLAGDWHTMESSADTHNNFWWNNTIVGATISRGDYADRPVRVLLFVGFRAE